MKNDMAVPERVVKFMIIHLKKANFITDDQSLIRCITYHMATGNTIQ